MGVKMNFFESCNKIRTLNTKNEIIAFLRREKLISRWKDMEEENKIKSLQKKRR